jgi:hypothetical protein
MAATDGSGDLPVTYHLPLSYRGTPLDGGDHALIGTSEHGVLGRRWIYDGTRDPVLVAQLFALLLGAAEPQAQSVSDTPDPSVTSAVAIDAATFKLLDVSDSPGRTDLRVETADPAAARKLTIRVNRVLKPDGSAGALGNVTAGWSLPDGSQARGHFVSIHAIA